MTQISVASKRIQAHIEDVEKQKPETRTMKTLPKSLRTAAATALLAITATISVGTMAGAAATLAPKTTMSAAQFDARFGEPQPFETPAPVAEPVHAAEACKVADIPADLQGSAEDWFGAGQIAVEKGVIDEFVVLKGASLKQYAGSLNALFGYNVPDTLSHINVGIRSDGSAVLLGFDAGCLSGRLPLLPGEHEKAYGEGA